MERNDTERFLREATRRAKVAIGSAAGTVGPQAPEGVNTGEVVAGVFVPYGRVGITEPKNGFLPRRTS